MNSKNFLGENIANLELIRSVLNFQKQTDKLRDFWGLQFVELFLPSQCYCNRCAVMRNPIATDPFWWVNTMGCHYTAMFFKIFDIKNFYASIISKFYKQQYLLQLKDPVVLRMLDSLKINYQHRKKLHRKLILGANGQRRPNVKEHSEYQRVASQVP